MKGRVWKIANPLLLKEGMSAPQAQTGVVTSGHILTTPPARKLAGTPPSKGGDFVILKAVH